MEEQKNISLAWIPPPKDSSNISLVWIPPPKDSENSHVPCFVLGPDPSARDLYADIDTAGGVKGDSGTDLRFESDHDIPPCTATGGLAVSIDLKVRARCMLDDRYVAYRLTPRSSIGKTPLSLANSEGIADRGYTGTLRAAVRNHGDASFHVKRGESLFQLVTADLTPACVKVVGLDHPAFDSNATARGDGGYGSTGAEGNRK